MSKPSYELLKGMTKEEKEEFIRAWSNAKWFTDQLKAILDREIDLNIGYLSSAEYDEFRHEYRGIIKASGTFSELKKKIKNPYASIEEIFEYFV